MKVTQYELVQEDLLPVVSAVSIMDFPDTEMCDRALIAVDVCNKLLGLNKLAEERVVLVALNAGMIISGISIVSHGESNAAPINIRGVLTRALLLGANNVIILHNHPAGSLTPSEYDKSACDSVYYSALTLGIKLLDFIIVAGDSFYSFETEEIEPFSRKPMKLK